MTRVHYTPCGAIVINVQKPPGGEWTQPIHPGCGGRPNFVIDSYGVLHLLAQEVGGMGTLYRQRLPMGVDFTNEIPAIERLS